MKYSIARSFFFLSLFFFINISKNAIRGHPARPGESRKSARELIKSYKEREHGIIQGYYPSWVSYNHNMKDVNPEVNLLYLSFAKLDLSYDDINSIITTPSLFKSLIGLEYIGINEYFNDAMQLRKARPDIIMILSLGGENYQPSSLDAALNSTEKIANLVDELGFDGIDVDYEPNGSFDALNNINQADFFVKFVTKMKEYMCEDKLISMSHSSNGALSCIGFHDPTKICLDDNSPYNANYFQNPSVKPELLRGANMASAGSAIYIMNNLKDIVDIIFVQTFNYNNTNDPSIIHELYDSYAYYGRKYDYVIIMGFNMMFSDNPFKPNDKAYVKSIGDTIKKQNKLNKAADGLGLWSLSNNLAVFNENEVIQNFVEALH
ncbi:chitinase, putative [Plasmodium gallinaceum]|uniref:Chitinase, putative n=1 Tax=Plasmodium gallinaceum TaxID=5849 RepID=A0A1J1H1G1_PLAGA|nr:chitinase, putative [Plasmodium gallinaceum]CRG97149.1 chitinase, putative [Plasmodium gallinaceum]